MRKHDLEPHAEIDFVWVRNRYCHSVSHIPYLDTPNRQSMNPLPLSSAYKCAQRNGRLRRHCSGSQAWKLLLNMEHDSIGVRMVSHVAMPQKFTVINTGASFPCRLARFSACFGRVSPYSYCIPIVITVSLCLRTFLTFDVGVFSGRRPQSTNGGMRVWPACDCNP